MSRLAANAGLAFGVIGALWAMPALTQTLEPAPPGPPPTAIIEPIGTAAASQYFFLHDDNFFALQTDGGWPARAKFQVSVRFELLTIGEINNFALNFAYTQKSFWDLFDIQNSSPFVENDYKPELFASYRPRRLDRWRELQLGLLHESDGLGATGAVNQISDSRGWSAAFVEARWALTPPKPPGQTWINFTPGVRAWLPFAVHPADLLTAIGYFYAFLDFDLRVPSHPWASRVSARIRVQRRSVQATLYYPLLALLSGGRLRPWLFLQIFHGEAERLITYNEVVDHFYAGFGFQ